MRLAALVVVALSGTAAAEVDDPAFLPQGIVDMMETAPRFALSGSRVHVKPKQVTDALENGTEESYGAQAPLREVKAKSADGKAFWIATDLAPLGLGCVKEPCISQKDPAQHHAVMLWQRTASEWEIVAWHIAAVVSGKDQAAAIKKGAAPAPIPKGIDAGAEDVVKLFESTIGDPKLFAASVSARKDVVLYGNEPAERTVGGAKVKAKLEAWKLGFKVRDGIQAGLTSGKTVAWVAANVDSTNAKKPKDKPVPYRLFAIYEKTGADWKLVHAHFAYLP